MRVTHLREAEYRRQRWKNGGGWTTELALWPNDAAPGDFDWRISIAEIESDGPFSTFPGCDRHIALLAGHGMRLEFDSAQPALLDRRLHFVAFAGECNTHGVLLDGPVRDFNVIARRKHIHAEALHRPLVGTMVFLAPAGTSWFIYLVSGQATLRQADDRIALVACESLVLQPDVDASSAVLDGAGDLVVVKLTRRRDD